MRDNNIGNKGVAALDKALKINTTLQNLYLPDKQLSALNESLFTSLFFNRSIPQKIEKITNAKIIEAKISVSDAAILTEDILDIVKASDESIIEGKDEEDLLKEKGIYDKYFDKRDLPRRKPGEDVDPSLVDQDLFNYTVQKSLLKKSANKRNEKKSESDLDSDDEELEVGVNDTILKPNQCAQSPSFLKLQDGCREGGR